MTCSFWQRVNPKWIDSKTNWILHLRSDIWINQRACYEWICIYYINDNFNLNNTLIKVIPLSNFQKIMILCGICMGSTNRVSKIFIITLYILKLSCFGKDLILVSSNLNSIIHEGYFLVFSEEHYYVLWNKLSSQHELRRFSILTQVGWI